MSINIYAADAELGRKDLISIIIPIYNSMPHLRGLLDSVLAQDCISADMEIILVDDGSTDESPAVCDEYAARDERIRVIHKQNAGVGAARNTGLDAAKGDYIVFFDSDDYVDPTFISKMYGAVKGSGAQMAVCGILLTALEGESRRSYCVLNENQTLSITEYLKVCNRGFFSLYLGALYNKIYAADAIKDNNVRFKVGVNLVEDYFFNINYQKGVEKVAVVGECLYTYHTDIGGSLTKKTMEWESCWQLYKSLYNSFVDLCNEKGLTMLDGQDLRLGLVRMVSISVTDMVHKRAGLSTRREAFAALDEIRADIISTFGYFPILKLDKKNYIKSLLLKYRMYNTLFVLFAIVSRVKKTN